MKNVVIVDAGDGSLARQLAAHGVEVVTGEVRARMVQALLPRGGGRWPDPDPRILQPWPEPSGEPLIVLRDPTEAERARMMAAKRKRERRQLRNIANEAAQGRGPEEVECGCGREWGVPNYEERYYCGSQWCMP